MGCGASHAQVHALPQNEPWAEAGLTKAHYDKLLGEFVTLDTNGDRKLNRKEFESVNKLPRFLGMSAGDISHLFNRIDIDKNGELSFNEFLSYLGARKDHLSLQLQVQPEKQRLEENMKQLGFVLCTTDGGQRGVPGDGNCQFYSLSWKLHGSISKADSLRGSIVEHLKGPAGEDVSAFYAPEHECQPQTFKDYLDVMSRDRTWGDQITLQAAADIFNVRIHVLTSSRYNLSAAPTPGQVGGRHYGAVQLLEPGKQQPEKSKDIWIAFAAKHYSPIDPSRRTPQQLLAP